MVPHLFICVKLVRHVPSWFPGASFQQYAKRVSKTLEDMAQIPYDYTKKQIVRCFLAFPPLRLIIALFYLGKWYCAGLIRFDPLRNKPGRGNYNQMDCQVLVLWCVIIQV